MYMGAWLHMFMVKHCRVHWQRFKTNGMKCKWKRSILATMPALSGIMQKSVFTTHIINCLVAHVQLEIINMSLLHNTDLMPYATSIQWAKLSCTFSVTSRDLKKKERQKRKSSHFLQGRCCWMTVNMCWSTFLLMHNTKKNAAQSTHMSTLSFTASGKNNKGKSI